MIRQVQRHQRLEARRRGLVQLGDGGQDTLAILTRLLGGRDRRFEVWHDDRPAKLAGAVPDHRLQHRSVS
jgi:hypothetical protein